MAMKQHPPKKIMEIVLEHLEADGSDDCMGLCVYCLNEQSGVEPDATFYVCEDCENKGVFGFQELLLCEGNISYIDPPKEESQPNV